MLAPELPHEGAASSPTRRRRHGRGQGHGGGAAGAGEAKPRRAGSVGLGRQQWATDHDGVRSCAPQVAERALIAILTLVASAYHSDLDEQLYSAPLRAFRCADASALLTLLNPPNGRFSYHAARPATTRAALELLYQHIAPGDTSELLSFSLTDEDGCILLGGALEQHSVSDGKKSVSRGTSRFQQWPIFPEAAAQDEGVQKWVNSLPLAERAALKRASDAVHFREVPRDGLPWVSDSFDQALGC